MLMFKLKKMLGGEHKDTSSSCCLPLDVPQWYKWLRQVKSGTTLLLWVMQWYFFGCHKRLRNCCFLLSSHCISPWSLNESRFQRTLISRLISLNISMYLLPGLLPITWVFCIITSLHKSLGEHFYFPVKVCWGGSWGQLVLSIKWCCGR